MKNLKEEKEKERDILKDSAEKNDVVFVSKVEETEDEKDRRENENISGKRDPDFAINDANIQFYDDCKEAAVIGDTIGDPLKDTSGPSINILIKLSSIISVVFGGLFVKTQYLVPSLAK